MHSTTTNIAVNDIAELEKVALDAGDNYLKAKKASAKHAVACGNALNSIKSSDPDAFDELIKKMPVGLRQCRKFMTIAAARKKAGITGNPGSEFLAINVEARLANVSDDIEKQVREHEKNEHAPQHELVKLISKLTAPPKEKKDKPEQKEPEPLNRGNFVGQVHDLNEKISSLCVQTECVAPKGDFKKIVDAVAELSNKIDESLSDFNISILEVKSELEVEAETEVVSVAA